MHGKHYLIPVIEPKNLGRSRWEVTDSIRQTHIVRVTRLANSIGKCWEVDSVDLHSFKRYVTLSVPDGGVVKTGCHKCTLALNLPRHPKGTK